MAKKFRCTVCGYIHEGDAAPEKCPLCKVPAEKFVEVEEKSGDLEFATEHKLGDGKSAVRLTVRVIPRLLRLTSVMLGRRQSTHLSSQS